MSALGYQYPAGAEHDPRAPWNLRDPEACAGCAGDGRRECPDCDGKGCNECGQNGVVECTDCEGTGTAEVEDPAIAKADHDADCAKDEPRDND